MEGEDDLEKELDSLRIQLKSGLEVIALPPSTAPSVNEVNAVKIEEVEAELEEMKKLIDES